MRGEVLAALSMASLIVTSGGCASSPEYFFNRDTTASLAGYRTFGFFDEREPGKAAYQSVAHRHLKSAIVRELQARGYRRSEQPELLVNIHCAVPAVAGVRRHAVADCLVVGYSKQVLHKLAYGRDKHDGYFLELEHQAKSDAAATSDTAALHAELETPSSRSKQFAAWSSRVCVLSRPATAMTA